MYSDSKTSATNSTPEPQASQPTSEVIKTKKKMNPLMIGLLILLVLISGAIAVTSLISQENVGDVRQQASTGEPPLAPVKKAGVETGVTLDFSQINKAKTQVDPAKITPAAIKCETQQISISVCQIGFWNVTPPTDDLEKLKQGSQQALAAIKTQVENGANLETTCKTQGASLEASSSDYYTIYHEKEGCAEHLFDEYNSAIQQGVLQQTVNSYAIYPVYDGGYYSDEIATNDAPYLSDYSLIRRNK